MINLENIIERIREIMDDETSEQLKEELNGYHVADLADIFQELKPDERLECFKLLDVEKAADLMEYLPPQIQVELLSDIDEELASKILTRLPHDAAADVLGDMEDDESETYLDRLPHKFSEEVRELLTYNEDTAGGIMNPVVLTVTLDMSVQDVLNHIRIKAEQDNMELYYVYVTDKQNHLLGVVSLRKLLTSPINQKVEDIMISDIVKLHVDDYSDFIIDEFMKYQYNALPVVDLYNRLKGMITWDDVHDLFEEETTEEIYQSSGISTEMVDEDEILSGNIINALRARTPWLFITLLGEFVAVNVANHFDHTLNALPIIAIFMPLLAGLGGNIGTQSITLMVRGLSTGQVTLSSAVHHIFREALIGMLIGGFFGVLVTLVTWGWQHNIELGIIVGVAMIINMTMATIIGTFTPFALKSLNVDPAVASGPVIATTIDVVGLAVYFYLVSVFLVRVMQ
ncbi:magnesium transporter [Spirochaetes bacterium]|uniref:Magnesium transporter MgtE n=1 Tax=Candidatus Scatousia excrementipullorum TaxID=2840936 RepID=A0A9D9DSY5_9BACT|nr:magnesium transporter [Candidatus Scatousia excrementipullorum]